MVEPNPARDGVSASPALPGSTRQDAPNSCPPPPRALSVVVDEQRSRDDHREDRADDGRDAEREEHRRRGALAVAGDGGEASDLLNWVVGQAACLVPDLSEEQLSAA